MVINVNMWRLASGAGHSAGFVGTPVRELGGEPTENSWPKHSCKVFGVVRSSEMRVVPEAVFGKMQAYPTPKNVKEMQGFVGIWGF